MDAAHPLASSADGTLPRRTKPLTGSIARLSTGSLAGAAVSFRHRTDMLHCVLVGHVVPCGLCPRCDRKALA